MQLHDYFYFFIHHHQFQTPFSGYNGLESYSTRVFLSCKTLTRIPYYAFPASRSAPLIPTRACLLLGNLIRTKERARQSPLILHNSRPEYEEASKHLAKKKKE